MIQEILTQAENDKLKLCSIFWYLIYDLGIPNETINAMSIDDFDLATNSLKTESNTITLDDKNGRYMKELIQNGKKLVFNNKNINRYFTFLGNLVEITGLISRDIIKTRDINTFVCPLCGKQYDNVEKNWRLICGRIACTTCAENEIKKTK